MLALKKGNQKVSPLQSRGDLFNADPVCRVATETENAKTWWISKFQFSETISRYTNNMLHFSSTDVTQTGYIFL